MPAMTSKLDPLKTKDWVPFDRVTRMREPEADEGGEGVLAVDEGEPVLGMRDEGDVGEGAEGEIRDC